MNRETAVQLLKTHIKNDRTLAHSLASEAILRALAPRFQADPEKWGMAGLLHDIDLELTQADLSRHGVHGAEMLREAGVDPEIVDAIMRHNEMASPEKREMPLHYALAAGETMSGLVMATAMVMPNKKLAEVKPSSVVKRMKEKAFAAAVNRDIIRECELIQIPLPEFAEICVAALQQISEELGL